MNEKKYTIKYFIKIGFEIRNGVYFYVQGVVIIDNIKIKGKIQN